MSHPEKRLHPNMTAVFWLYAWCDNEFMNELTLKCKTSTEGNLKLISRSLCHSLHLVVMTLMRALWKTRAEKFGDFWKFFEKTLDIDDDDDDDVQSYQPLKLWIT